MILPYPIVEFMDADNIAYQLEASKFTADEFDIAINAIQRQRAQLLVDMAALELVERGEPIKPINVERQHLHDFAAETGDSHKFVTNIWSQLGKRYAAHHARTRLFWYEDYEHLVFPVRCSDFNERMASFDAYTQIIGGLDVRSLKDYVDAIEREIEQYGSEATEKVMGPGLGMSELRFMRGFADAKIKEALRKAA